MSDKPHILCPHCAAVNRVPSSRLNENPKCGSCHQPLFVAKPMVLDEARFARYLQYPDQPMLIDFWASWCGPCRMMAPEFEKAAITLEPSLRLAKVDTEANQGLAARYAVRSIPTLVLLKGGKEAARMSGAMKAADIVSWARSAL